VAAAPSAELGPRAEVTLAADELSLRGSRKLDREGDALLERAAGLRERLYRRERRQVDALEAVEILRELARRPGRACSATLRRILLEAELTRDPAAVQRELESMSLEAAAPDCRAARERALLVLAAYRNQLAPAASATHSPAEVPPKDGVVQPKLLTPSAGPSRIVRVEPYGGKDSARVVVHSTAAAQFSVGQVADPGQRGRLYIDVKGATLEAKTSYEVGGLVERVRLGQNPGAVRIVLELSAPAERRVFYVPEPFRLVIDVSAADGKKALAVAGPRSVHRVVLDPGHGRDHAAHARCRRLRAARGAHRARQRVLGRPVHFDPLQLERRRRRQRRDDLRARRDQGGLCHAPRGALANALRQLSDPEREKASLHFAGLLQRAAMSSLLTSYREVPDGGVKRAGFYVLAGARMPAVLFETSFISSLTGESRFNSADFRQRLADAIVNSVRAYREGL
jgi:N-acetylmuramoyl-L-alanine amidase